MISIDNIYKVDYMANEFAFVGTLRNEKVFNINDNVYFSINNHDIFQGVICGVELPPAGNPEYIYKIRIPNELIKEKVRFDSKYPNYNLKDLSLKCDTIFYTKEEAKKSALKNLEKKYNLQLEEIEKYFKD